MSNQRLMKVKEKAGDGYAKTNAIGGGVGRRPAECQQAAARAPVSRGESLGLHVVGPSAIVGTVPHRRQATALSSSSLFLSHPRLGCLIDEEVGQNGVPSFAARRARVRRCVIRKHVVHDHPPAQGGVADS